MRHRASVGSVAGAVKSGEPALAPLQKIKFPTANTARASRIPQPTAIRSQLRKRGRDRGSPSMCCCRSGGKECDRERSVACAMYAIL